MQTVIENGKSYIKKFCSRECANSRIQTNEMNEARSLKLKGKIIPHLRTPREIRKCKWCSTEFEVLVTSNKKLCSKKCSSKYVMKEYRYKFVEAGLKSAKIQSETRRSKNEIHFAELCKSHFGNVKTNEQMFNGWDADVIIEDIKTAVMWNGKWHYEKITEKHSVKQFQNRDKIKINEIKNAGYTPYIIKDMGRENKEFVKSEFDKFIKLYGEL